MNAASRTDAPSQGRNAALAYDAWFETRWGRYATAVETRAWMRAAGRVAAARVLDAGCGTTRSTQPLLAAGARVVGLDRDRDRLAVAAKRTGVPLVLGDIGSLPFRAASFDVAVAITVLEWLADPAAAIAELARVTRPGGRVVVGALNRRSPWGLAHGRELRGPAWSGARFLPPQRLRALGESHGDVALGACLYAPGWLPGLPWLGPALETIGRLAPQLGAFQVLEIRRR